jgi:hypothetical protein
MGRFTKGQAALEFLTTYGWAFLVILVMIGALAYFGVLNPDRFVTNYCKLDGQIECNSIALGTDNISINIKNNLGQQVNITRIEVKESEYTGAYEYLDLAGILIPSRGSADAPGALTTFTSAGHLATNAAALSKGEKKKFDVLVYYTVGASTVPQVSSGSTVTTLQ